MFIRHSQPEQKDGFLTGIAEERDVVCFKDTGPLVGEALGEPELGF